MRRDTQKLSTRKNLTSIKRPDYPDPPPDRQSTPTTTKPSGARSKKAARVRARVRAVQRPSRWSHRQRPRLVAS